jgi:hypothetical protein
VRERHGHLPSGHLHSVTRHSLSHPADIALARHGCPIATHDSRRYSHSGSIQEGRSMFWEQRAHGRNAAFSIEVWLVCGHDDDRTVRTKPRSFLHVATVEGFQKVKVVPASADQHLKFMRRHMYTLGPLHVLGVGAGFRFVRAMNHKTRAQHECSPGSMLAFVVDRSKDGRLCRSRLMVRAVDESMDGRTAIFVRQEEDKLSGRDWAAGGLNGSAKWRRTWS